MSEIKFLKIINSVIGKQIKLNINSKIKDIKNWDSLNNFRIVTKLNQVYKKNIKFEETFKIVTIKDLFNKLKS